MYLEYRLATEFMILKTFLIMWRTNFCCIKFKILKTRIMNFKYTIITAYGKYAWKKDEKEISEFEH